MFYQQKTNATFHVGYTNNFNAAITGIVRILIEDPSSKQKVAESNSSMTLQPGAMGTENFTLPSLAFRPYSATFFVTFQNGTALSGTATIFFALDPAVVGGTGSYTLANPPVYCTLGTSRCYQITYRNNLNNTVTGIVFLVIHNSVGQTASYSTTTLNIPAGQTGTSYNVIFGLAPGMYKATIFATSTGGTAIATQTSVVFKI